jgi:predicted nucleic acid-binding protein
MLSLDTNVLVYAVDKAAGTRHVHARQIVDRAAPSGAVLTEQSLFEFFHVATRKGKMSASDAETVVRKFARDFALMLPHPSIVADVLALQSRHRLGIWDARLLAVCAAHGCTHLLTEDLQDGAAYGTVTVVNPFNAANARLIGQLLS